MIRLVPVLLLLTLGCTPTKGPADRGGDTGGAVGWDDTKTIQENCFPHVASDLESFASYDRFNPTVGRHCAGTQHQDIQDVEKLVFLGDSITAGTWPSLEHEYYRNQLTSLMEARFGELEVADCSEFGARTDDFLEHTDRQITACFPGLLEGTSIETKRTLVVWTMGGNDLLALGDIATSGSDSSELLNLLEDVVEYQRAAISFFKDQEAILFPAGVDVVFTNNYEYTDGTGDFGSCTAAETLGFDYEISSWALGYLTINEAYLELAVETSTDMVFLMENFCGHGFYSDDPDNGCYLGPDTERYFDPSCIHPSPEGHEALASLFDQVVGGD
jgi:lysophospholipase L1-like esterase